MYPWRPLFLRRQRKRKRWRYEVRIRGFWATKLIIKSSGRKPKTGKAKVFRKLADMYYEGIGLPEADYKKAFQYYKLAAAKGASYSMYRLGMMYLYGEGVEPSKLDALAWLGSAVESGYKNAKADYERVDNELQLDDIIPADKLFLIKM